MKRIGIIILSILILSLLCACSDPIDYTLPKNPIEFHNGDFVNPDDPEDTYMSLTYNGRTYIGYGTLKGSINGKDVGTCLGYYVQDGEKYLDSRIFTLSADPEENYLVRIETEGFMNQPDFFRAIDTRGKDIPTPSFITGFGYEYWK